MIDHARYTIHRRREEMVMAGEIEERTADVTPPLAVRTDAQSWPTALARPRTAGRLVFVNGGTRGIGAAIAKNFATQGAVVAAGYSRGVEHAQEFLASLKEHDARGSVHQGGRLRTAGARAAR
jgi:hypothetical protein